MELGAKGPIYSKWRTCLIYPVVERLCVTECIAEHCLCDTEAMRKLSGNHLKTCLGSTLPCWQRVTLLGQRVGTSMSRSLPAVARC